MAAHRISRAWIFMLVLATLTLSSCASYFTRKECERTDWFEFGKSVAMSGNRLSGNSFVRRCEDAEANINHTALDQGFKKGMATYCQPDTVLALGKRGEFFAPDMCDGENPRLLKQRHEQGVAIYCQKSNGQAAGATGKQYNQICPKELEEAFLVEFNKGRKKYLLANVQQAESEIDDIDRQIRDLERRRTNLGYDLNTIGDGKIIRREMKYDPVAGTHREEVSVQDDPEVKSRRERILSDMRSLDQQIDGRRGRQQELRRKIRELNAEILTL
jgi:hypothetical protein